MQKLGIILFGASAYENHKDLNNPRFATSIKEIKKAVTDPKVNRSRATEVLDLFNKPLLPNQVAMAITDFIRKDCDDFIVYYCGHGDVGRREGDYRVFLRQSNRHLRNSTLLHIAGLIRDVQVMLERKRVFFVIDACYSGSAISEMETMDAGGAEKLIDRNLLEAIEGANGMAVLAASGRLAVAFAKQEDKLTLFTGAFVRCLGEGIAHKSDLSALSWLDIKDEIVRTTRDRLGLDAPVPKLTNFSDAAVDITRVPFFNNQAYVPRPSGDPVGWGRSPWDIDERTSEHLYWKNITDESSLAVLDDFLTRFPKGVFVQLARGLLGKRIDGLGETEIETYLRDHPATAAKGPMSARLAALKRDRIQTSTDVAGLERFVAEDPESEFAVEAKNRIDFIRQEVAESEAWERVKTSPIPEEIDQFLKLYPDGRFSKLARARLAELSVISNDQTSEPVGLLVQVPAEASNLRRNWRRHAALAVFLVLGGAGAFFGFGGKLPVLQDARDRPAKAEVAERTQLEQIAEADRKALGAAGTDLEQLRKYVRQCIASSCTVLQEARDRLAKAETAERARLALAEADRKALDAAGNDLRQLRQFVQQCSASSCIVLQEARTRLGIAEAAAARTTAERRNLDLAGENPVMLRSYLDRCSGTPCEFAREARDRLERVENFEVASGNFDVGRLQSCVQSCGSVTARTEALNKLGIIRSEEASYNSARGKLSALQAYARDCKACKFRQVAQTEIAELTKPKPSSNFNLTVGYDMDGGDINSPDFMTRETDAATCLAKCQATNGCIAYSFDKWIKTCYLKDKLVALTLDPRSDTNIRRDQAFPGLLSNPRRFCRYPSLVAVGDGPPGFSSPTAGTCEQNCEADQACVAYVFRVNDKQCRLLRNTLDRQKGVGFENMTSGVKTQVKC